MGDRISIIVLTFNRKEKLARLLESFRPLRCPCPVEIIIVDNHSTDDTFMMVREWMASQDRLDVRLHVLPERAPVTSSRNAGIRLATGNILAFTDDDCVADPAWIENLYRELIRSPGLSGLGGRVLPLGSDVYSDYYTIYRILEPPPFINAVITANCMIRRQAFTDAGMFDEYFMGAGGEEIALCMKLWLAGHRFGFAESAIIYHDYRQGLRDFLHTAHRYGCGDRFLFQNDLYGYLRYMQHQYPEQIRHGLAFRSPGRFQALFLFNTLLGTATQFHVLGRQCPSLVRRLALTGLYACYEVAFHMGRGTFRGVLPALVKAEISRRPGLLITVPAERTGDMAVLELSGERLFPAIPPCSTAEAVLTIRNPDPERFVSAKVHVMAEHSDAPVAAHSVLMPHDMFFPPMTEIFCGFPFAAPETEGAVTVRLYLVTCGGGRLSRTLEWTVSISAAGPEGAAGVPAGSLPGETGS